jgi:hypothetical protein
MTVLETELPVSLQVLHVADCPNLARLLANLAQATDATVTTRQVDTEAEAVVAGMAGSPTLLINGVDPFATPDGCECGVACRIYRDDHGRVVPVPSVDQLRDAIIAATTRAAVRRPPGEVLSAWRTRAVPLDPAEKAVHQAILRAWAASGRPPTAEQLEPVAAGTGRVAGEVLAALHDVDAIRLTSDGQIVVAYPFSATPTRHRVRIGSPADGQADEPGRVGGGVNVYAMCAIDALGISAMVDGGTRIESVDVTTGAPVTVTMPAPGTPGGRATWEPAEAVVFVGAAAGGGPSADCCCDYLNFFTSETTARAWIEAHPDIPGQILTQAEAEALGTRLFGPLLVT